MFIISLILLLAFIFGGLAFFLNYMLTRNVTSATSHLQGMIKENTEKQEEMQKKIEQAEKEYAVKIKKAKEEAEQIEKECRKAIEQERDKIISQAHEQSEELMTRAKKTCETILADMDKNVNEKAVDRAAELICKVLPEKKCYDIHVEWVRSLINQGLNSLERLRIPGDVSQVEVITAFALTDQEKTDLHKQLQDHLDLNLSIVEKVQAEIVAGIIINIGTLVLDGSFANKIREVAHESFSGNKE
ncbi:MAG: F0F1 ATP synthase subunit delta [Candidatus Omnitrophica bacterium]|nr:F0F1 ATP synthase subunit delta [Candidatus Omnitrophota bacterium]